MNRETWLAYFEAAPEAVQYYLLDRRSAACEAEAQEKLAYDNDAWDRVLEVVWDLVFTKLSKSEFRLRLKTLAGDRKLDDVERILLFHTVLPLADLVTWDVDSRLRELGMSDAETQTVQRVTLRPVSYGAAVRRIAADAKISLLSEELVRRLREALVSYIKGVRTVEQFIELLQRGQSESGLGFTREQAQSYFDAMKNILQTTDIVSEEEYSQWLFEYEHAQEEPVTQPTVKDNKEQPGIGARSSSEHLSILEQAIDEALAQADTKDWDDYKIKRLRNLVSTRLRDVRNPVQVKDVLKRDEKVGGLGIDDARADVISVIIENVYTEQRQRIADDEKQKIDKTVADQQTIIEDRKVRDKQEREQWYQEKVKTLKGEQDIQQQAMDTLKKMSEASSAGLQVDGQPPMSTNMDGVVAPTRLVSLPDELAGLTLAEFRRMAKTPQQAGEKIKQKFLTLKEESFERWTEGVQGWRNSPLQRLYLQLMTESFAAGVPVAELVENKHKVDAESAPTAEELGVIIALNSELQF